MYKRTHHFVEVLDPGLIGSNLSPQVRHILVEIPGGVLVVEEQVGEVLF